MAIYSDDAVRAKTARETESTRCGDVCSGVVLALIGALTVGLPPAAQARSHHAARGFASSAGETDALASAQSMVDPAQRAAALEAFVAKYPSSPLRAVALEQAIAAYLALRDLTKVETTARRAIAIQPNNARALATLVFALRAKAGAGDAPRTLAITDEAARLAERGLRALADWKPREGVSPADADVIRRQMSATFEGALGYRAFVRKDYAAAQPPYRAALKADSNGLDDSYQLAISMLQSSPVDPEGFWWAARAYDLAGSAGDRDAQSAVETYAKAAYRRYHGNDEGWSALLTQAGAQTTPPPSYAIKPAPSLAEVAVQAARDAPVSSLSISDWEFILAQRDGSPDNHAAADKIWAGITALQAKGVRLKLPIKVMAVGPSGLEGAITDANQKAGRADLRVKLKASPRSPPAVGSMVSVTGLLTDYAPKPFVFTMDDAELGPP